MSTPTDGSQVTNTASYPAASNLVKAFTHGNGLATTNTHSLDYELSRCQLKDGALSLIDKSYARADKLNITSITDGVAPSNSQSLWYNKSNRLQNANGPWGNKTFYYDGTGNRTFEITGSVTDTLGYPGGSNRVANVVTGTATTRTFSHDGAGNITTDTRSGSAYTFGYNARGRLAKFDFQNGPRNLSRCRNASRRHDYLQRTPVASSQPCLSD